ncbi:uncharacterized protein LOC116299307 isoform X2 [Actinia tenebrosa]|uniref:Uncharacterized protein LOC116299307 isoform X2 n=1 Tax=Actinia tenebrosa TaxID=6105 RepID=A0A6P8I5H1_ACTTE|nr:uncharacterized protein LOC116299307 isoform X2 [Actinia tenebrosa]
MRGINANSPLEAEVERFLSDLAGASLSAEYEKRRLNLEKKISTVRKISPPPQLTTNVTETLQQKRPRRLRSWSFPPMTSQEPLLSLSGRNYVSTSTADSQDGGELGVALSNSSLKDEKESQDEEETFEETEMSLCNGKRFERLRQAYNSAVKIPPHPRQRSASVPHVSTAKQDHRKPNPEYIQVISSLSAFVCEKRKECERKPNKKGFNVAWRCGEEDEG